MNGSTRKIRNLRIAKYSHSNKKSCTDKINSRLDTGKNHNQMRYYPVMCLNAGREIKRLGKKEKETDTDQKLN